MSRGSELWEFVRFVGEHRPSEGFALAFVAYFDDSDHELSSMTTLAGYMARIDAWKRYEEHSRRIYDKYEIGDILHAKELYGTKPPFEGWPLSKKFQFIDDLFEGQEILCGIATSIHKKSFKKNRGKGPIGPNSSPLGIAFNGCIHAFTRRNVYGGIVQAEGLSVVVESGHRNNGDIERTFHFLKTFPELKGVLRTIAFADKLSSRAVHLPDLLAFFARRQHSASVSNPSLIVPHTRYLRKLESKVPTLLPLSRTSNFKWIGESKEADVPWLPVPLSSRPKDD